MKRFIANIYPDIYNMQCKMTPYMKIFVINYFLFHKSFQKRINIMRKPYSRLINLNSLSKQYSRDKFQKLQSIFEILLLFNFKMQVLSVANYDGKNSSKRKKY